MKVTIDILDIYVSHTIVAGQGTGISYWCSRVTHEGGYDCYTERETGKVHFIDERKIRDALALMAQRYPFKFAEVVSNRSDRATGDILIQLACFGELKYG